MKDLDECSQVGKVPVQSKLNKQNTCFLSNPGNKKKNKIIIMCVYRVINIHLQCCISYVCHICQKLVCACVSLAGLVVSIQSNELPGLK